MGPVMAAGKIQKTDRETVRGKTVIPEASERAETGATGDFRTGITGTAVTTGTIAMAVTTGMAVRAAGATVREMARTVVRE